MEVAYSLYYVYVYVHWWTEETLDSVDVDLRWMLMNGRTNFRSVLKPGSK